jgi:hypothetical protein
VSKVKRLLFIGVTLLLTGCGPVAGPPTVEVLAKDGESCLLEHKCKISVVEVGEWSHNPKGGFYRCYVSDEFYALIEKDTKFVFDPSGNKDCAKISP